MEIDEKEKCKRVALVGEFKSIEQKKAEIHVEKNQLQNITNDVIVNATTETQEECNFTDRVVETGKLELLALEMKMTWRLSFCNSWGVCTRTVSGEGSLNI